VAHQNITSSLERQHPEGKKKVSDGVQKNKEEKKRAYSAQSSKNRHPMARRAPREEKTSAAAIAKHQKADRLKKKNAQQNQAR